MIASERKLFILRAINDKGIINLKEIARELQTSEATVRRDLEKLEKEGKLVRVQGGATVHTGPESLIDTVKLTMHTKAGIRQAEKAAVAKAAAALVRDGESVFLDCGTSIAPVADWLLPRPVRIVTYSTLVLQRPGPKNNVILVGGEYSDSHGMLTGALAEEMLKKFHFDHAFIGCYGVSLSEGKCYQRDVASTNMKRIGIAEASRSYLLLDDSKLEKHGLFSFTEMRDFDRVFCNLPEDAEKPDGHENMCWVTL